ncbi:MAG: YggT family protein [Syntrophobacterales bacterium]|nr:YggT family protein [Syntrophobacterales bacterium]
MFVAANFIEGLARVIDIGLTIYMWMIIARAVLSWVNPDPYNHIVMFLYRSTEPVLYRIRRWIPLGNIGIDISPIIVILVIIFLQSFLVKSLLQLSLYFK